MRGLQRAHRRARLTPAERRLVDAMADGTVIRRIYATGPYRSSSDYSWWLDGRPVGGKENAVTRQAHKLFEKGVIESTNDNDVAVLSIKGWEMLQ